MGSGVVFLSDLAWVHATAGAGDPVRRDTNYYGQPKPITSDSRPISLSWHTQGAEKR
jgi:hypothetical protein